MTSSKGVALFYLFFASVLSAHAFDEFRAAAWADCKAEDFRLLIFIDEQLWPIKNQAVPAIYVITTKTDEVAGGATVTVQDNSIILNSRWTGKVMLPMGRDVEVNWYGKSLRCTVGNPF